jgi:hypothetical protein
LYLTVAPVSSSLALCLWDDPPLGWA